MVRQVENLRMAYLNKGNTSSIHDNIVTWRKMLEIARNIVILRTCQLLTYLWLVQLSRQSPRLASKPLCRYKLPWSPHPPRLSQPGGIGTSGYPELDSLIIASSRLWSPEIYSADCLASEVCVYQKTTRLDRRKLSRCPPLPLRH
jgi:hypothetical protein